MNDRDINHRDINHRDINHRDINHRDINHGQPEPSKASILRRLLSGDSIARAIGAHNGLTARLGERAGFEAVWASGFEISASYALPDASILSMTQFLDAADAMNAATALPVIADCDTGFGGPPNVAHAVRSYEGRGIAGICIEDKLFPKLNSFAAGAQELLPIPDFARKLAAAKRAQSADDFVLIARTEALVVGLDLDEALRRAEAYREAGADAILIHSKSRDARQVLEFAGRWRWDTPLVAVPTSYADVHEDELRRAGFALVIYANQGLRAAIRAVTTALSAVASAGYGAVVDDQIVSMDDVFDLQGMSAALPGNS
jgi:phosphoenolpyruvate phosphomutase